MEKEKRRQVLKVRHSACNKSHSRERREREKVKKNIKERPKKGGACAYTLLSASSLIFTRTVSSPREYSAEKAKISPARDR